jgi:crotonobetainyl-CoA:carnitine CoA-transferase CaiB-like acyl-CoA transferase
MNSTEGFLRGVRVLEIADELGEYAGKLLAGLGADVVKVEPPGGEATRQYGPFYQDRPDPDRSLYFWHYNLGKRGITLDLDSPEGRAQFMQLAAGADVVLETRPGSYMKERGLDYPSLKARNPALVYARISPFGDSGPWAGYKGSDLVHLALGGVMMNCGYDPQPSGQYDTPPIAPQMWQAYHIAGEMAAMAILAALIYRRETGVGQYLSTSVHDAVSKNTEGDVPNWVYLRSPHLRKTCRHSIPSDPTPPITRTKDGRWLLPYQTYLPGNDAFGGVVRLLKQFGMQQDLEDPRYQDPAAQKQPSFRVYADALCGTLVGRFKYAYDVWKLAQREGLAWAPLRYPAENLADEHWARRETFFEVHHPELNRSFMYTGGKWLAHGVPWQRGPRAPLLGEHTAQVLSEAARRAAHAQGGEARARSSPQAAAGAPLAARATNGRHAEAVRSKHGKPFALSGVRVIDLSWFLASGGAGRFFTALGAEVIKVEHTSRIDPMRWGSGRVPEGGRAARDRARQPLSGTFDPDNPDRGGTFFEINAGKRGVSLNLKHPRGKALLTRLIQGADMIIEGYSPGTMERMGFGYEQLCAIKPDIIYVQQSGLGQRGTYGSLRTFGPSAQGFSGLSEMSGLPDPYAPAGIGYSYLDWFGAYNMAVAMLAALYRRRTTGKGCYIDSSQVETGIFLTGTAILDYTVNGRQWTRYGNRSPYKPAAPHGAYPAKGADRWIAIACFTHDEWREFTWAVGKPGLATDPRFATLEQRLRNQDELDRLVGEATAAWDGYALMEALQKSGVPAGVCQTAEDRIDFDPQLRHLEWLVELAQRDFGMWPVKELPVKFSETPPYIGGFLDRAGPSYGQDNDYVFRELLGLRGEEVDELRAEGVI